MNNLKKAVTIALLGAITGTPFAYAAHYYVDVNVSDPNETNNGLSWATAFGGPNALQRALTAARASTGADEIWVADGTYKPVAAGATQDRSISFHIPKHVKVYGGFAGGESSLSQRNELLNVAILDGDIGTASVGTDNSFHVVYYDDADHTTTKLSGFTIRNGYAYDSSDPTEGTKNVGGGIYVAVDDAADGPSLERLKISCNTAYIGGGGAFSDTAVSMYFTNCRFEFNKQLQSGGEGGAVSLIEKGSAVFQNCVFFDNESNGLGGAFPHTPN